ncbi:MAG: hypothetical protein A2Y90_01940 [Chloroflexi bacterium RBG_13_52_12]|nr:MAG: hypothetical protein A2Y90_01940 [Chloroflexi bacterium RBG_13_52_12]
MLLADWTDYKGLDISGGQVKPPPELPGSPLLPTRWLPLKYTLHVAVAAAVPALVILILFVMERGWPIWALLGLAAVAGLFYAAPPFHYAFFSTAILPPVIAFGTCFVMTSGNQAWEASATAMPVLFMSIGTIYTYRVLYQSQDAAEFVRRRRYLLIFYVLGYMTLLTLIASAVIPAWTLLGLLPAPLILVVQRLTALDAKNYFPATSVGVLLHTITGLLIATGYLVTALVQ